MTDQSQYHHDFYKATFVDNSEWGTKFPNEGEVLRASKIMALATRIAKEANRSDEPLKILDVGSGRGWLSQLLTFYGVVQGVEPVTPVVEHARKIYPHIEFTAGTPRMMLDKGLDNHFDLIVSSEVLEHVPYAEQQSFMRVISDLLNETGDLILTTPRAEIMDVWMEQYANASQPIEDWVSEAQLAQLVANADLTMVEHNRFLTYSGALRKNILDRALLKILTAIGYQYAEPKRLTTYQIIHAKK